MRTWVALLLVTVSCATAQGNDDPKLYVPVRDALPGDADAIFRAIVFNVAQQDWTVVRADPRAGVVEALGPERADQDTRERERWIFVVQDSRVDVKIVHEAVFSPGTRGWETSDVVCAHYDYAREVTQLHNVGQRLRLEAGAPLR